MAVEADVTVTLGLAKPGEVSLAKGQVLILLCTYLSGRAPGPAVQLLAAVQAETQREGRLVFPPLIVTEFLHVATDAKRFAPPLTVNELKPGSNGTFQTCGGPSGGKLVRMASLEVPS